jgi:hypothetical protein
MTRRISYKEISIALGIIVAAVIVAVLWLSPSEFSLSEAGSFTSKPFIPSTKILVQKLITALQASFR